MLPRFYALARLRRVVVESSRFDDICTAGLAHFYRLVIAQQRVGSSVGRAAAF